jgi:hypothetical protein
MCILIQSRRSIACFIIKAVVLIGSVTGRSSHLIISHPIGHDYFLEKSSPAGNMS